MRTTAWRGLAGTRAPHAGYCGPYDVANAGIATLDDDLETRLRASPLWRDNDALLQRAKGSWPVCARTLLLEIPELGTRTRQQIATSLGVALLSGDSGTLHGRRAICGRTRAWAHGAPQQEGEHTTLQR